MFTHPAQIEKSIASGQWKPNMYLSNMALAYFSEPGDFVAKELFPVVPVELASSYYYKFSKADLARDDMQRKPQYGKVAPAILGQADDNYNCKVDQLILGIDQIATTNYQRSGAPGVADPRKAKVRAAVEKTNIHLDRLFAENYFKAGVWTNQYAGKSATPGTSEFLQFDQTAADPIALVDKVKLEIKKEGRRMPNKLAIGVDVFTALKNNDLIVDRVKYSGSTANPATVTENVLAQLFGVKKVVVPTGTYNSGDIGQETMEFICDPKGMLLLFAPDAPSIEEPSAGYTFAWNILGGENFIAMTQYEGEPGTHSEFIEALMAYDMKRTSQDLAAYFTACVA